MAAILYFPATANRKFVVYQHVINNNLLYIGVCRMSELMAAPDAHKNSEWKKIVTSAALVEVKPLTAHDTLEEAQAEQARQISQRQPYTNIHGTVLDDATTRIRCIDTGETFDNASAAARRIGASASAISNHLNKRPSYNTVKGYRFERITT